MAKTKQVRWNGAKEDPDSIVQFGVTFEKGVWTSVPDDSDKAGPGKSTIQRLIDNPTFSVKGHEPEDLGVEAPAPHSGAPARAPNTTYTVQGVTPAGKRKPTSWVIVDKDGNAVAGGDEYADEASAQVVADAMNKVP